MSDPGFSERRSSARLDMEKQIVSVSWIDEHKKSHRHSVVCSDVSRGGLKLEITEPIALDDYVDVQLTPDDVSAKTFRAKVVRCIELKAGLFELGLKFTEN